LGLGSNFGHQALKATVLVTIKNRTKERECWTKTARSGFGDYVNTNLLISKKKTESSLGFNILPKSPGNKRKESLET
jgi:hypothetical protein